MIARGGRGARQPRTPGIPYITVTRRPGGPKFLPCDLRERECVHNSDVVGARSRGGRRCAGPLGAEEGRRAAEEGRRAAEAQLQRAEARARYNDATNQAGINNF